MQDQDPRAPPSVPARRPARAPVGKTRALLGAALLDLAVSPLFASDVFTASLRRDLDVDQTVLTGVFSVGLVAFMTGVLAGGRVADRVAPRRLALFTALGTVAGLLGSAVATSVTTMFVAFGVLLGASTGLGYATAVRVAGTVQTGRGLALGLVVSAYAAGTAVLSPTAAALLDSVGRSATFVLLAAALGCVLVVGAVLVPARAPHNDTPPDPNRPTHAHPKGPVVTLWLAFGLGSAPALAAFAQTGQLTGAAGGVALAVALLNTGNFAGRLVAGPLSDRVGRSAALHANSALLVLACLPLAAGAAEPGTPQRLTWGCQRAGRSPVAQRRVSALDREGRPRTIPGPAREEQRPRSGHRRGLGLAGLEAPALLTVERRPAGHEEEVRRIAGQDSVTPATLDR